MMATIFDQKANDAAKENALKMLKDDGARLFDLGYNEAKRKAEQEQKARDGTTKMIPAQDKDFESYREHVLDDDLHFWCEKCEKPLTGHWAMPEWWNFCPWCGRKFVATEEAWKAALERRWEKAQKQDGGDEEDDAEAKQVKDILGIGNCPFCGGAAKAYAVYMGECDSTRTVKTSTVKTYGVQCAGCGVRYDAIFPSAEDAIAAWNLRAKGAER